MALFGASECPLCETLLQEGDDLVATTHFIGDESDPLWPYSDSAMHRACFLRWPLRESFLRRYNSTVGSVTWGNGTYHEMQPDGTIVIKRREDA